MDTILSSLNALVEKLGGDTTDNKLIVDALNDISAKYGGESDNKLIVDALNDIVDNYNAYKLRDFTIVNNTSLVLFMMTTFKTKHGIEYASSTIAGNNTVTRTIVGSAETKNGFGKQNILFSVPSGTVNSVTSEGLNIVFTQVGKYLVVEIPLSPKDITLTIA